jgi:hypothetical protein
VLTDEDANDIVKATVKVIKALEAKDSSKARSQAGHG